MNVLQRETVRLNDRWPNITSRLYFTDLQQKSPEFRTWWSQHNVQAVCDFYQEKELNHPQVGRLFLSSTVLIVPVDPPLHLVTFTPCSQETVTKLETVGETERLHALTVFGL